jgi:hypothetical protein
MTDGLGRMAVLKMGYLFFQRSGTLGGNLVAEEGDLGCFEGTHFNWLIKIPYLWSGLKRVRKRCSCSSGDRVKMRISSK